MMSKETLEITLDDDDFLHNNITVEEDYAVLYHRNRIKQLLTNLELNNNSSSSSSNNNNNSKILCVDIKLRRSIPEYILNEQQNQCLYYILYALAQYPNITELTVSSRICISGNIISRWLINDNRYVKKLYLPLFCNYNDNGWSNQCNAIATNTTITELDIGKVVINGHDNKQKEEKLNELCISLQSNCTIQSLKLWWGHDQDDNIMIKILLYGIRYNKYIQKLIIHFGSLFCGRTLTMEIAQAIQQLLLSGSKQQHNNNIQSLSLHNMNCDCDSFAIIAKALVESKTNITELELSRPSLWQSSREVFIDMIANMSALKYLNLSRLWDFTPHFMTDLFTKLKENNNSRLEHLVMSFYGSSSAVLSEAAIAGIVSLTNKPKLELFGVQQSMQDKYINMLKYCRLKNLEIISNWNNNQNNDNNNIFYEKIIQEIPNWKEIECITFKGSQTLRNIIIDTNVNTYFTKLAHSISKNLTLKQVQFPCDNNNANQYQFETDWIKESLTRNELFYQCIHHAKQIPHWFWSDLFALAGPTGSNFIYQILSLKVSDFSMTKVVATYYDDDLFSKSTIMPISVVDLLENNTSTGDNSIIRYISSNEYDEFLEFIPLLKSSIEITVKFNFSNHKVNTLDMFNILRRFANAVAKNGILTNVKSFWIIDDDDVNGNHNNEVLLCNDLDDRIKQTIRRNRLLLLSLRHVKHVPGWMWPLLFSLANFTTSSIDYSFQVLTKYPNIIFNNN